MSGERGRARSRLAQLGVLVALGVPCALFVAYVWLKAKDDEAARTRELGSALTVFRRQLEERLHAIPDVLRTTVARCAQPNGRPVGPELEPCLKGWVERTPAMQMMPVVDGVIRDSEHPADPPVFWADGVRADAFAQLGEPYLLLRLRWTETSPEYWLRLDLRSVFDRAGASFDSLALTSGAGKEWFNSNLSTFGVQPGAARPPEGGWRDQPSRVAMLGQQYQLYWQEVRAPYAIGAIGPSGGELAPLTVLGFREDIAAASPLPSAVVLYPLLGLVIFVGSFPLLRLVSMGSRERLRRTDIRLIWISLLVLGSLSVGVLNQEILARGVQARFEAEDVTSQVEDYVKKRLRQSVTLGTTVAAELKGGAEVEGKGFLSNLPYAVAHFSSDGTILARWFWDAEANLLKVDSPLPGGKYDDRQYFKAAREGSLWTLGRGGQGFVSEVVRSRVSGRPELVTAVRAPANGASGPDVVAVIVPLATADAVIAPGFEFAVIDDDGNILMHSSAARVRSEQIEVTLAGKPDARGRQAGSLIRGGRVRHVEVSPLDSPVPSKTSVPWRVLVMRDEYVIDALRLDSLGKLALRLSSYGGGLLLGGVVALVATRRRRFVTCPAARWGLRYWTAAFGVVLWSAALYVVACHLPDAGGSWRKGILGIASSPDGAFPSALSYVQWQEIILGITSGLLFLIVTYWCGALEGAKESDSSRSLGGIAALARRHWSLGYALLLWSLIVAVGVVPTALAGGAAFADAVRDFVESGQQTVVDRYRQTKRAIEKLTPQQWSAIEAKRLKSALDNGLDVMELLGNFVPEDGNLLNDRDIVASRAAVSDSSDEIRTRWIVSGQPEPLHDLAVRNWSSDVEAGSSWQRFTHGGGIVVLVMVAVVWAVRRVWLLGSLRECEDLIGLQGRCRQRIWVSAPPNLAVTWGGDALTIVDLAEGRTSSILTDRIVPRAGSLLVCGVTAALVDAAAREALLSWLLAARRNGVGLVLVSYTDIGDYLRLILERERDAGEADAARARRHAAAWEEFLHSCEGPWEGAAPVGTATADLLWRQWPLLSDEERLTFLQAASEGVVNPWRKRTARFLVERGMLEYRPSMLASDPEFARRARSLEPARLVAEWEREEGVSLMWLAQCLGSITLVAVAVVLSVAYPSHYSLLIAGATSALGALGPAIPLIGKTFGRLVAARGDTPQAAA